LLSTAVGTGLRQGELPGITVDALDLDAGTLHVRQQLLTPTTAGQPYLMPLLKTRAGHRVVPLPDFLVTELRRHLDTVGPGVKGLLFVSSRGSPGCAAPSTTSSGSPHRNALDSPRLRPPRPAPHLRLQPIAQGQSLRVVMERLGHASVAETMATYGHLFPSAHGETDAALDRASGGARFAAPSHLRSP
jgi:integrase